MVYYYIQVLVDTEMGHSYKIIVSSTWGWLSLCTLNVTNDIQTDIFYAASKVGPYLESLETHTALVFLQAKDNTNVAFYIPLFFLAPLYSRSYVPPSKMWIIFFEKKKKQW